MGFGIKTNLARIEAHSFASYHVFSIIPYRLCKMGGNRVVWGIQEDSFCQSPSTMPGPL